MTCTTERYEGVWTRGCVIFMYVVTTRTPKIHVASGVTCCCCRGFGYVEERRTKMQVKIPFFLSFPTDSIDDRSSALRKCGPTTAQWPWQWQQDSVSVSYCLTVLRLCWYGADEYALCTCFNYLIDLCDEIGLNFVSADIIKTMCCIGGVHSISFFNVTTEYICHARVTSRPLQRIFHILSIYLRM